MAAGMVTVIWFLSWKLYREKLENDRLKRSRIYEVDKTEGRQFEYYLGEVSVRRRK
jgi:hypothetical protein